MKIDRLSEIEYKYIFNIDSIVEAQILSRQRNETIQASSYFSVPDKNRIKSLSEDLLFLINQIIKRNHIIEIDDYNNALNAAVLANSEIQIIVSENVLRKQFGKLNKSHPLTESISQWRTIQVRLGAKSWGYMFMENHSTVILIFVIFLCFCMLVIFGAILKNIILGLAGLLLLLALIISYFLFIRSIEIRFYIDNMKRIKNTNQYRSGMVLKTTNKELISILINTWKKI